MRPWPLSITAVHSSSMQKSQMRMVQHQQKEMKADMAQANKQLLLVSNFLRKRGSSQIVVDLFKLLSIYSNHHRCTWIAVDLFKLLLIYSNCCRSLQIAVDLFKSPSIYLNRCWSIQIGCRSLQIAVDLFKSPSIYLNRCRSLQIVVDLQ